VRTIKEKDHEGWQKLTAGYPWYNCEGCFPLPAYSEFMPSPRLGISLLGNLDNSLFAEDDPYGWRITEMEEEYELKPGIEHVGRQIMNNLIKLGKGLPEHYIHGHGGQNLKDNPYWPPELSERAGTLDHERYVTLLPLMLSRTQDDKGRVPWTLFGNSIHDPEETFWKNFYSAPGAETPANDAVFFFTRFLSNAYSEKINDEASLLGTGFRILPVSKKSKLPGWTQPFKLNDTSSFNKVRYLLSFRPFSSLPQVIKEMYFSGSLSILPFPGSLVFWGMPGYLRLQKELPSAGQIPLLNLVARNRGIEGLRVPQSGWIHEPHPGSINLEINENLVHDSFQRTHRWQKLHRYQDELNQAARKIRLVKVLFSTEPDAMGLYDKPMARNSHLWSHSFELLLDGPKAARKKIQEVEKIILKGGLFGYRFFYPPMRTGIYEIYLHRPLVGYVSMRTNNVEFDTESLHGYLTCYHPDDSAMSHPVELWPRILRRDLYLSALNDFNAGNDYYTHQTSMNILSLLDSRELQNKIPLTRSYAASLLNISKQKSLEKWLDELNLHTKNPDKAEKMKEALEKIIQPRQPEDLPEPITYTETATRQFEENWWNDIRFLANGEFIYKDNADIIMDAATLSKVQKQHRDLGKLGDYLISRHRKAIDDAGMKGKAFCGELPFKWKTDFEFPVFGGWVENQKNNLYERNILVVIPGKNRKEAVILGDHYDTAYMEDIYEKEKGGSGARLSAKGADDNNSASATLLQAAPVFLRLSKDGKLERDIWLIHLTGEEFPSDCMGARNFCQSLIERKIILRCGNENWLELSDTKIMGVFIMDMIGHNRENASDIFQISPGKSIAAVHLAWQAHLANMIWNAGTHKWNQNPERQHLGRGKRINGTQKIPEIAKHLPLEGEVRTHFNPHSSIFNTDGQIFSDIGVPVVLFMENYDIFRSGYHDSKDTLENIDLDYGAALAAIAIETVARVGCLLY
jgi:hypothetical protein